MRVPFAQAVDSLVLSRVFRGAVVPGSPVLPSQSRHWSGARDPVVCIPHCRTSSSSTTVLLCSWESFSLLRHGVAQYVPALPADEAESLV